jgi:hypothetical protein
MTGSEDSFRTEADLDVSLRKVRVLASGFETGERPVITSDASPSTVAPVDWAMVLTASDVERDFMRTNWKTSR